MFILQNIFNPYLGAQYPQLYGSHGTLNPAVYPYVHIGQPFQTGPSYPKLQSYAVPGPHIVHFASPGASPVTTLSQPYGASVPAIQGPFPSAGRSINRRASLSFPKLFSMLHFLQMRKFEHFILFFNSGFTCSTTSTVHRYTTVSAAVHTGWQWIRPTFRLRTFRMRNNLHYQVD